MSEQQYRVHACNNTEPHEAHEFRGTYRKPSLPGVEITETFQCEGIERPEPTTDRPDLTRDQFTNDESYYLATGQHPSLPTREQIAELIALHYGWGEADEEDREAGDAVLALIQKGADR